MELNDYFVSGRDRDKRELKLTRKAIEKAYKVFPDTVENNRLPYDLQDGIKIDVSGHFSQSTNSMILFSLMASSSTDASVSSLIPKVRLTDPIDVDLHQFNSVWKELLSETNTRLKGKFPKRKISHTTYSSTFGHDDPLSLSWMIEIISSEKFKDDTQKEVCDKIISNANDRVLNFFKTPVEPGQKSKTKWLDWKKDKRRFSIDHAFLALRYVQLAESLSVLGYNYLKAKWVNHYFENRVHEQLSKFEIRDGDFDAAELIFALEGMLRLEPKSVGGALLDRVFEVITESQQLNPYWRPVKPIVATPQGNVLFPLSVETAGSLLRCCSIIDKTFIDFNSFSKNIDLFMRFSEWLRARSVSGWAVKNDDEKFKFFGWHSEHVHLHPGIHIWETSNVLLFFQYYTTMLEKHIAKCSLNSANLHEEYINRDEEHRSPLNYWDRENGIIEPLQDVNEHGLQPYSYARTHLISPRSKSDNSQGSDEKHCSVLLYGPPGTGKTTFAEEICKALEWPLITVTPSDFIHGGESEVESRAKRIFEVLEDQIDAVILLDEIDRMILDRSSIGYTKQGDIFQFMTPSMLTKLRNLRKKERAIFIIATNYKERIDSAAIRKGRVDEHLLMSPANLFGRVKIIEQIISNKARKLNKDDIINNIQCKNTALNCSLCTYGEIESLVNDSIVEFFKKEPEDQINFQSCLEEKAEKKKGSQSVNLMSYKSRFDQSGNSGDKPLYDGRPFTEFFTLLYIKLTDNIDPDEQENKLIINAFSDLLGIDSLAAFDEMEDEDKKTCVEKKLTERCPELGNIIINELSLNFAKLTKQ